MKTEPIDIYSEQSNFGVVRMPRREFPGAVIQGDSLYSLFSDAVDVVETLQSSPDSEAFHAAFSVAERLEERLRNYIEVCEAHGIEWKFDVSPSTADYASLINEND